MQGMVKTLVSWVYEAFYFACLDLKALLALYLLQLNVLIAFLLCREGR